jgi:hypothetical protein
LNPPTVRIAIASDRQCPHAMQMPRQHKPRINLEWPAFPRFPNGRARCANVTDLKML